MDYGSILSRSISIAVKRPSLWIFGLFAAGQMQWNIDTKRFLIIDPEAAEEFQMPFKFDSSMILPLLAASLGAIILMIICLSIARPAMIDAVNKLTRGGVYRFGESFSRGVDFFGRYLSIILLYALLALTCSAIVVGSIVLSATAGPVVILVSLVMVPLGLVTWLVSWHTFSLSEVAMVARDISVGEALSEGWALFRSNIGKCAMITLIWIGIGIAIAIIMSIIGLMTFVPINIFVATLTDSLIDLFFLGILFGLPISLVLGGIIGTFTWSLYIQFYFGLLEPAVPLTDSSPTPAIS